jgi:hypothetical protein
MSLCQFGPCDFLIGVVRILAVKAALLALLP